MRRHSYTSGSGFFIREHFKCSRMKKPLPEQAAALAGAAQEISELGTPLVMIKGHTVAIIRQEQILDRRVINLSILLHRLSTLLRSLTKHLTSHLLGLLNLAAYLRPGENRLSGLNPCRAGQIEN